MTEGNCSGGGGGGKGTVIVCVRCETGSRRVKSGRSDIVFNFCEVDRRLMRVMNWRSHTAEVILVGPKSN